jgi:hypothetical protein
VAGSAAGLFEPQAESRAQSKKMDAMRGFMDRLFIWIAKAFGNKSLPFYRFRIGICEAISQLCVSEMFY